MNKLIYISLVIILFYSCSKKVYYTYEDSASGSYCTFEIDGDITTYRAVSIENYYYGSYPSKKYVYLISSNIYNRKTPNISSPEILAYIDSEEVVTDYCDVCDVNTNYLYYAKKNDSLQLRPIYKRDREELMKKENLFYRNGLLWFPPYVKKVKKIDYKKFNMPYKKGILKDPFLKRLN